MKKKSHSKVNQQVKWLQDTIEDIFTSTKKSFLRQFIKIFVGSIQKFDKDEAMIYATSIGYNLVVSFVPTLVVILLIGARFINIDELFFIADEFILKNSIPLNIEPYKYLIRELLESAGAITGVGFLIMFFSATSVLRNLENALHKIWHVHKKRPFIQKISSFIMVLLFGFSTFAMGISIARSLLDQFSPHDLTAIKILDNKPVILGDKHTYIQRVKNNEWKQINITTKIDFELQSSPIIINAGKNTVLSDKQKDDILSKIHNANKADVNASTFTDITRNNDAWWMTTDQGCLIHSKNKEKVWYIQCYQRKSGPVLYKLYFNRIKFFNSEDGIIIGNNGLILVTHNAGKTWQPNYLPDMREDLSDIEYLNASSYIILGTNFTALLVNASASNWQLYNKVMKFKKEKKNIHLTDVFVKERSAWIIGNSGTMLQSKDQGETWEQKNIGLKTHNFQGIHFINNQQGILISENGKIRYTNDSGDSWHKVESPTAVDLNALNYDPIEKKLYIVGNSSYVLTNHGNDFSKLKIIQEPEIWRVFIQFFGNILLPFILIWIVFFLIYKTVPYTFVSTKAASAGAATTSVLWVIFLLLYKYYISFFAKGTFAIYGTLSAIPLTLLLLYVSIAIMLFGAEVSFYVQFPKLLKLSKKKLEDEYEKRQIWYGFEILYSLYHNFEHKKGGTPEKDLQEICNNDDGEFSYIMKHFLERGYVHHLPEESIWLPAVASKQILLQDIIADLDPSDYSIMNYSKKNQFMKRIKQYFSAIEDSKKEVFGKATFADILKE